MSTGARVAVVFTGGTISMLPDPVTGAASPSLDGAAILDRVGGLGEIAEVVAIDWGLVPASHLSLAQILELAGVLERALARPDIDGAVLVQGTDVMEETAFAFDVLLSSDKPVCVVGAMRNAGDPAWDGPRNLRDAVRVAAAPDARDLGVVVVMAGSVLPADDAVKMHTSRDDALGAPNAGRLGTVGEEGMRLDAERTGRRRLARIPPAAAEPVFLVTATVGMDGALVRVLAERSPAALVVAATGSGNTHPDLLEACREQMDRRVPVALTTRCVSGQAGPGYGFPGGGATWVEAGALLCGTLSGPKSRIALALGLGAGLVGDELRGFLAGDGAGSMG